METCGLVLVSLFVSPPPLSLLNCKVSFCYYNCIQSSLLRALGLIQNFLDQKEMIATKEYIALKYATLEESDTLLQMKLKAHRATLAEDDE